MHLLRRSRFTVSATRQLLDNGMDVNSRDKNRNTLLHYLAAKNNITDVLKLLINRGALVNDKNEKGQTPLHIAIKHDREENIILLLDKGANVNTKDKEGKTPLHLVVEKDVYFYGKEIVERFEKITKLLLEKGAHIDECDNAEQTALLIAVIADKARMIKILLDCGAKINTKNSSNMSPLHFAVITSNFEIVKLLLDKGADITSKDKIGNSPLHLAVERNNLSIAKFLLKRGALVDDVRKDGYTALHTAVYHEKEDSIILLLNNNANVNAREENGKTALHILVQKCLQGRSIEVVQKFKGIAKLLLSKGISVNSVTNTGRTVLHAAVSARNKVMVKLLLENDADCDKRDKYGLTPIHLACQLPEDSAESFIKILIKYKACTSVVDGKGRTPLHYTFHYLDKETKIFDMIVSKIPQNINISDDSGLSHFHIVSAKNFINQVESFLKSGVPVDSSIISGPLAGYSALHFAVLNNHRNVVEMLLKWNAQVNIKTRNQQLTPLHIACNYFNMEFLKTTFKKDNFDWTSKHNDLLEIVKLLILHKADVNAQDSLGRTPLHFTCMREEFFYLSPFALSNSYQIDTALKEIIQILLLNKANINTRTHNQKSILHIICENNLKNLEELLEFCINKGADINLTDVNGFTPLHVAVKTKNKICVEFLLKHKAHVNAKSEDFKTPLSLITEDYRFFGRSWIKDHIFLLLVEYGSDVNIMYKNDRILWIDALEENNNFVIYNLINYGADINVEDSLGNPLIVSVLSKWHNQTVDWRRKSDTFLIIFTHLQKLLSAGFHINESVKKCCYDLRQHYRSLLNDHVSFSNIENHCEEELHRMKHTKIDNYNSLHSILFKSTYDLSKQVKNSTLVNVLEDENFDYIFPLYSPYLKAKFKKSRIRSELLESAYASLFSVIGFRLPDLCYDLILKHLANEEISNLKKAAS